MSAHERRQKEMPLLKLTLSLAFLCGFALSRRLWVPSPGRLYPQVPVFDVLPPFGVPLAVAWFGSLVLLLVLVALRERPRVYAALFVALTSVYVLWDESRLQPWVYQYLFMMLALAAYSWKDRVDDKALRACAFVVASVYFWSGVQKINPHFFADVVPSILAPYLTRAPAFFGRLVMPIGVLIPLTEICAGVFLLTRRWRTIGVVLALATHVVVLVLLVPFRRNNVVWPWNVAMAAFVVILFRSSTRHTIDFMPRAFFSFQTLAILLFGLAPAFSLFGLWPQYLSSALYSGNVRRAEFVLSERVVSRLPARVQSKLAPAAEGFRLDINHWSYAELNVPAYSSDKVDRAAGRVLCEFAENPMDVRLEVTAPPRIFFSNAPQTTSVDCGELTPLTGR